MQTGAASLHARVWAPEREASVLCIHGLGGSALTWAPCAPLLAARLGRRVVAPDLPGLTVTPALPDRPATIDAFAELLAGLLGPGPPALVMGNSLGAALALRLAALVPERVQAVVLASPALPPVGRWPTRVAGHILDGPRRALGPLRELLLPAAWALRQPWLFGTRLRALVAHPDRLSPDLRDALEREAATVSRAPGRTFLAISWSLTRYLFDAAGFAADARNLPSPALLVHGGRDRIVPVSLARMTADRWPLWGFVVLDQTGHLPQLEQPERFVDSVAAWLPTGVDPAPAGRSAVSAVSG